MYECHAHTPAARVIAKFGGAKAVSEVIHRARQNVERWTKPRDKGGTGGLIPADHMVELARHAAATGLPLRFEDFFPDDVVAALGRRAVARNPLVSWGWVAGMGWSLDTVTLSLGGFSHASTPSKSERKP